MLSTSLLTMLLLSATAAFASPIALETRWTSSSCPRYTLLNTRDTGEVQGESVGFRTMNSRITAQLSGGDIYNTVYPAGVDQNIAQGTQDIINHITTTLASDPAHCFILQGYSQGAAATVNAMPSLTGNAFNAVKGVFLIGDPERIPNLACNVDNNGGKTTAGASGLEAYLPGIPSNWVSKTLDVCILGDGVCHTASGFGITFQHLLYGSDAGTQNLGTSFALKQLGA